MKERIASLTRQKEVGYTGWDFDGGRVEVNKEGNRLQIFFNDKPDKETRAALKSNGFRWAPSVGAWQRQLNDNAISAADRLEPISDQDNSEEQEQDGGMQMF